MSNSEKEYEVRWSPDEYRMGQVVLLAVENPNGYKMIRCEVVGFNFVNPGVILQPINDSTIFLVD